MKKVNIDVRKFAIPSPLIGSIESHSGYGGVPKNGQEIHQIFQLKQIKEIPNYTTEKYLSMTFERTPYEFVISGRADGFINLNPPVIQEIKSSFLIEDLYNKLHENSNHPYIWQIKTYGYIHYQQRKEIPKLELVLISSRNFKTMIIEVEFDITEYEAWMERRLEELFIDTKIKEKIFNKRLQTSKEMSFPFLNPRPGQIELVEAVLTNFEEGTPLLIEAPTGLGKTMGIIYPALKESLSRGQKVVVVNPKNSQHQVAELAVGLLQEQGQKIRSVTITSKAKMCMKTEVICNPQFCEYAKDYYEKLATHDLVNKLGKTKKLTNKKLIQLGEEFQVCPFELSLEAVERADVVISDYNYVFSPRSLIGRLAEPFFKNKEKPNLVIDEAHNLPSRAQDYFSPSISISQVMHFDNAFKILPAAFLDSGVSLVKNFHELIKKYAEGGVSRKITIDPAPFFDLANSVREFTTSYLESDVEIAANDPVLGFSNLVNNFTDALELTGEEFFQTYQKTWNDEMLKITCCDASEQLKLAYKEFKNSVAFSATLKPFSYYKQLLGFSPEKTKTFEFASPFDSGHRKIMLIPQISTKYKDRDTSAPKICDVIERVLSLKKGNYIALFPSFEFMKMVTDSIKIPDYQVLIQQKEMKLPVIKNYLNDLREGNKPTLLMGVQGGVFSEGVDYPGDMLIGAFVVGPALPNFDFEREQIRNYYEKKYGAENAFDYAYVYPAMAKAVQSAGRVVRTETDRGLIILIDPRFLQTSYYQAMPSEWFDKSPQELVSQKILQDIRDFWGTRI
ncbi:MAG: ATP-dependent DNA helicase [Bacteriovorax sp.]|nr:ATP-dependent DNA helicase [Bacteriovorax sp.]